MKALITLVVGASLLSGCGFLKHLDPFFDDEETGTPVRSLDQPVPGEGELPTPAEAAKIEKPDGMVQFSSVGFYSHGKIWSYWKVGDNNLWTVRPQTVERKRNFANFFLWQDMVKAAQLYYYIAPMSAKLVLWDISKEFGGFTGSHISHQMGLDVDVKLPTINDAKDINMSTVHFEHAWKLATAFVMTGNVNRIFTDPKYKKYFCAMKDKLPTIEPLKTETLRALRAWPNHGDHFHVRFRCYPEDKLCVDQVETPPGDGC